MIITQTPLRLSFAGGGTDFPDFYGRFGDGAVLSTAIDKYIYVVVKKRFDAKIRVGYSVTEMVDRVDELRHELVREAIKLLDVPPGIEIATMADIPSTGSGLGSSSSVTVGVLNALHAYKGETVPADRLAEEACEIEIGRLGKPIGKQDQYIAACGGFRLFGFHADGTVSQRLVKLSSSQIRRIEEQLLLLYVGFGRDSTPILSEQLRRIEERAEILKTMARMPRLLCEAMEDADGGLGQLGETLREGWELKKKLSSGITNEALNGIYERATQQGATGGKVVGAGGVGFMLLFCPNGTREAVRTELSEYAELPFSFERDGSKAIFNIRR